MKTLFTVCVLLVCGGCRFEVIGLNGPYDNISLEDGEDVWLDDGSGDANGEIGKLDHDVPDVAEMADEDSFDKPDIRSDDELGMPEIPDIPDITDTDGPPDVPDVWPDVPDVHQDIDEIGVDADETSQEVHEVNTEVNTEIIVEVVDPCEGVDCADDNICTKDFCIAGECVNESIAGCCNFDDECDDDDVCNGIESCVGNECSSAQALKCNDDNVCTDDSCDAYDGCVFTPNFTVCNDNNLCTVEDICDENAQCAGKLWCVCFTDADCLDDGDMCNGAYECQGNFCVIDPETVVDCADDDPCTKDSCDAETGKCVNEPIAGCCNFDDECDDDDVCNGIETCLSNKCSSAQALKCNDDNPCTDDACVPSEGCVYTPNEITCNDSNPCTINDACQDKVCAGKLVPCECQSTVDCAKLEDGNLCNGTLKCQDMICVVDKATAIICPSTGNPCMDSACDSGTGECVFINNTAPCSDGDKCTTGDTCANGFCQSGTPILCDDKNMCTTDACNPSTGLCVNTDVADCCNSEKECDNADKCDGAETCVDHKCVPGTPLVCDDDNECTGDICVPVAGCVPFNLPNNTPCDDKDACTMSDTCQAGKCKGGTALICADDNNICTDDSCDPVNGCVHTPNLAPCDDGSPCTADDTCLAGVCQGTPSQGTMFYEGFDGPAGGWSVYIHDWPSPSTSSCVANNSDWFSPPNSLNCTTINTWSSWMEVFSKWITPQKGIEPKLSWTWKKPMDEDWWLPCFIGYSTIDAAGDCQQLAGLHKTAEWVAGTANIPITNKPFRVVIHCAGGPTQNTSLLNIFIDDIKVQCF